MFTARSLVSLAFVFGSLLLPLVASSRQSAARAPACAEVSSAIVKVGPDRYQVRRQEVLDIFGNHSRASRTARIVPEMRDGKATAFRLYSVQRCGLAARLGFQNGDIVTALNGLPISTPEQALAAHVQLQRASEIQVSLERGGRPKLLTYVLK